MPRPLRVLHIASECSPFAKSGGLGDVVGALPIAQRRQGVDARVVLPLYRGIDWNAQERLPYTVSARLGGFSAHAAVRRGHLPHSDAPIYFLEHHEYYDRGGIYGDRGGEFRDNVERFAFLCKAAFAVARAEGFSPDIVHAHDWQAALAPVYVNTTEWGTELHGAGTVLTIHNLGYQGQFQADDLPVTGLGWEHFNGDELMHFGALNLLKGGIVHANRIVAVSPTYAREIQHEDKGARLDGVIRRRAGALSGVLNGIDADVWNPATDHQIAANFSADNLDGKWACKAALQREAGLPERHDVPVFGIVTRLTHQKGMDVVVSLLHRLLERDVQLVMVGTGDGELERAFRVAAQMRPDKVAALIRFDDGLAHRTVAGSDFILMPSRYEPCGLTQMYGLRYGALPLVHATGGLADTVWNYEERTGEGTGFRVDDLSPSALYDLISWALWAYHHRGQHIFDMRIRAMRQDFGWDRSADRYREVYEHAIWSRRGHGFQG